MTIEDFIRDTVKTAVKNVPLYAIAAPEGVKTPFVVYRKIADKPVMTLSGYTGISEYAMRLYIVADTYAAQKGIEETLLAMPQLSAVGDVLATINAELAAEEGVEPDLLATSAVVELRGHYQHNGGHLD